MLKKDIQTKVKKRAKITNFAITQKREEMKKKKEARLAAKE
jgi:hypothetical protein